VILKALCIILISFLMTSGDEKVSKTKEESKSTKEPVKENLWTPYSFKGTEHFEYAITMTKGKKKSEGIYILDLEKGKDEKITMHVKGTWEENSFESTVTVSGDDFFGILMGQMMMNPAAAPLMVTLFTPYWSTYLTGRDWKIGSGWEFKQEGESSSFKVEKECEYAGVKGFLGVLKQNEKTLIETCVSSNVALPLAVSFKGKESYNLELKEYKE